MLKYIAQKTLSEIQPKAKSQRPSIPTPGCKELINFKAPPPCHSSENSVNSSDSMGSKSLAKKITEVSSQTKKVTTKSVKSSTDVPKVEAKAVQVTPRAKDATTDTPEVKSAKSKIPKSQGIKHKGSMDLKDCSDIDVQIVMVESDMSTKTVSQEDTGKRNKTIFSPSNSGKMAPSKQKGGQQSKETRPLGASPKEITHKNRNSSKKLTEASSEAPLATVSISVRASTNGSKTTVTDSVEKTSKAVQVKEQKQKVSDAKSTKEFSPTDSKSTVEKNNSLKREAPKVSRKEMGIQKDTPSKSPGRVESHDNVSKAPVKENGTQVDIKPTSKEMLFPSKERNATSQELQKSNASANPLKKTESKSYYSVKCAEKLRKAGISPPILWGTFLQQEKEEEERKLKEGHPKTGELKKVDPRKTVATEKEVKETSVGRVDKQKTIQKEVKLEKSSKADQNLPQALPSAENTTSKERNTENSRAVSATASPAKVPDRNGPLKKAAAAGKHSITREVLKNLHENRLKQKTASRSSANNKPRPALEVTIEADTTLNKNTTMLNKTQIDIVDRKTDPVRACLSVHRVSKEAFPAFL